MTAPGTDRCAEDGPVGDELRLLLLALLDRFEPGVQPVLAGLRVEAAEAAEAAAGDAAAAGATAGTRPVACEWCPVCASIALFRGDRPELGGRIAEQVSAALVLLRATLEQRPPETPGDTPPPAGPPPVQHIPVQPAGTHPAGTHPADAQSGDVPGAGGGC